MHLLFPSSPKGRPPRFTHRWRSGPARSTSSEQAISLGYDDRDWMEQDPDLEILKTDPEFQQLLGELKPQS